MAFSGIFLYLAFRRVDVLTVGHTLRQAKYGWLFPATALTFLSFYLRAHRWRYLLESIKWITLSSSFSATMIGFMANNLLPARLGEFVRAYVIGRREAISRSASFATIVVERLFDGFTLVLCLVAPLPLISAPRWIKVGGATAFGVYVVALGMLLFLKTRTDVATKGVEVVLRRLPGGLSDTLKGVLSGFTEGLATLSKGPHLGRIVSLSLLVWIAATLAIYCVFEAFALNLPIYAAFLLQGILALGVMIPSSPGYVGTIQLGCVMGLALFGVSKDVALSLSLVFHISQFVPITLIGLFYLWREHWSLAELSQEQIG